MALKILPFTQEDKWINACQAGEPLAQRQVYEQYSRRMLGVCYRYVGNEMDAEEVLINGFLKVFAKIGQFKREGSFEGWIRRIMVNEALIHLRRTKSIHLETDLESIELGAYPTSQPLEADDLLNLIQTLPIGYKTVFNLYAIEGYSHKEIADMLHISESTSKSQLFRARSVLQQYLAKNEIRLTCYGNER